MGCGSPVSAALPRHHAHAAKSVPSSAPPYAKAGSWPASRKPPPRPAAQTSTVPRRSAGTWARRRCRSRASTPTPAWQSARPRREWPARSLPCFKIPVDVLDFDGRVVDQDPTANARPPSVMMLTVSPSHDSATSEQRIDSGIETAMMSVERKLPRKIRIITPVRHAAMMASRTTPLMAPRTKMLWSARNAIFSCGRQLDH